MNSVKECFVAIAVRAAHLVNKATTPISPIDPPMSAAIIGAVDIHTKCV